jgi:hypothetical protein
MNTFGKLELSHYTSVSNKDKCRSEYETVTRSDKQAYGFFPRVSKEETLANLDFSINSLEGEAQALEKMIILASQLIINIEIKIIKEKMSEEFNEILFRFTRDRLRRIEEEAAFLRNMFPSIDFNEENTRLSLSERKMTK